MNNGHSFDLVFDQPVGKFRLLHGQLGLEKLLTAGRWDLATDLSGKQSCYSECGARQWCADQFDFIYHCPQDKDEDEAIVINVKETSKMRYIDFKQSHVALEVNVPWKGSGLLLAVGCYTLLSKHNGVKILWSLRSWHESVFSDRPEELFSRWYNNWWKWWEKGLVKIGLDEAHLRRSSPIGAKANEQTTEQIRFLSEPTVSTYALLAVLTRLAKEGKQVKKDKEALQGFRNALKSIIAKYFVGITNFRIYLDEAIEIQYGQPLRGFQPVDMPVSGTEVNLLPLLAHDEAHTHSCLNSVNTFTEPTELIDIFIKLCETGAPLFWLWKHFLNFVGRIIDEGLSQETLVAAEQPPAATPGNE